MSRDRSGCCTSLWLLEGMPWTTARHDRPIFAHNMRQVEVGMATQGKSCRAVFRSHARTTRHVVDVSKVSRLASPARLLGPASTSKSPGHALGKGDAALGRSRISHLDGLVCGYRRLAFPEGCFTLNTQQRGGKSSRLKAHDAPRGRVTTHGNRKSCEIRRNHL